MFKQTFSKDWTRLVSTVETPDGKFETMVFACVDGEPDGDDLRSQRYDTPHAAIRGHRRIVDEVNAEKR